MGGRKIKVGGVVDEDGQGRHLVRWVLCDYAPVDLGMEGQEQKRWKRVKECLFSLSRGVVLITNRPKVAEVGGKISSPLYA